MNDEDIINIVDEVFEEMEVDDIEEIGDESSNEDHVLSADSDCISDCNNDLTQISQKIVTYSQINALNEGTKHCVIYFYYSTGGALAVCASCMINLVGVQLGQMYPTRKHVIDSHDAIDGRYCSECHYFYFSMQYVPNVYTVKKTLL